MCPEKPKQPSQTAKISLLYKFYFSFSPSFSEALPGHPTQPTGFCSLARSFLSGCRCHHGHHLKMLLYYNKRLGGKQGPGVKWRWAFVHLNLVPNLRSWTILVVPALSKTCSCDCWQTSPQVCERVKDPCSFVASEFMLRKLFWQSLGHPKPISMPDDSSSPLFSIYITPLLHPLPTRSCLGLLYVERRGSVFYRLDSLLGGVLVATLGGLVQYSRDHGWESLGCSETKPLKVWKIIIGKYTDLKIIFVWRSQIKSCCPAS